MPVFAESTVEKAALRDALLPKLLSGAVRVRQAEVDGVDKVDGMDMGRTNNA
jgi:hypothetical protein